MKASRTGKTGGHMRELDYAGMGMRIRKMRKAKGLSQDELAKECGICLSFMGHIERGTRCMSLETFANICESLNMNADELLWGNIHLHDSVLDIWNLSDKNRKKPDEKTEKKEENKKYDSYATYVRIMKSVAEIMNES